MKTAIIILSDPKNGTEESAGRALNALSAAHDVKSKGASATILFQLAGTRRIGELSRADHPFHGLFETVKDKVAGASLVCPTVFGAGKDVERAGYYLLKDNPGTNGLPSLSRLARDSMPERHCWNS